MKDYINHWGLAMEYAESKIKLEMGVSTKADYDHQIDIKEGYEAGFLKAVELFKTDNELMIKTYQIQELTENSIIDKDYTKHDLDVKFYRNGDEIPEVKDNEEWAQLTTGAWCYYDNDPKKGILYNWYAVNDPRGLAPNHYKIPTIEELEKIDLGLPGAYRYDYGGFGSIGAYGYWWSATEYDSLYAWYRGLYYGYDDVYRLLNDRAAGCSVRCLRDL